MDTPYDHPVPGNQNPVMQVLPTSRLDPEARIEGREPAPIPAIVAELDYALNGLHAAISELGVRLQVVSGAAERQDLPMGSPSGDSPLAAELRDRLRSLYQATESVAALFRALEV